MTQRTRLTRASPSRRQAGLSLVELMVAITIALFILAGVSMVFVNMKKAFTSQDGLAQLQDTERFAMTALIDSIESAGYFADPVTFTTASALPADAGYAYGAFGAGQGIVGQAGATATTPDTISTRYQSSGSDGLMDCLGNTYAVSTLIYNTYGISGSNELQCSVRSVNTVTGVATVIAATPLVSGVSLLKVSYGVNTGVTADSGSADSYVTAAAVTDWSAVRTARLSVDFVNPYAAEPGQSAAVRWMQTVNLMNAR
ncbi:MAG: PilW family protein [Burkholderiaceae bacterium]